MFDSNVMSSHLRSHHVMSCHITSHHVTSQHRNVATFWVRMNNVATLAAMLLEIYEQRSDVGHERHDVAGFSNDKKLQNSNLRDFYTLPSCSFFILTILDHLMTIYNKNNTRSKPFDTKNLIFENFENMGTKNQNLSTINRF